MMEKMQIQELMEVLSSKQPTPGGGGASALAGALGTALGLMVGNLTVGKKKYAAVEEEVKKAMSQLHIMQRSFMDLADHDASVFTPLAAAYSLPAGTEEEKAHKEEVMERCLMDAARVPLDIMEQGVKALAVLEVLERKGSVMAVSDVGVAAQLLRTAVTGAAMNVYINIKSMKKRTRADELKESADKFLRQGMEQADRIYENILKQLEY